MIVKKILLATVLASSLVAVGAFANDKGAWSGNYAGLELGGAWMESQYNFTFDQASFFSPSTGNTAFSQNLAGFVGGAHIGHNWQSNHIVLGLEGAIDGLGLNDTATNQFSGVLSTATYQTSLDWLLTLTPKIGWVYDNLLFFFKMGVGVTQETSALSNTISGTTLTFKQSQYLYGADLGAGIDYLYQNWIFGISYDYLDFSNTSFGGDAGGPGVGYTIQNTLNLVKATASYKFSA